MRNKIAMPSILEMSLLDEEVITACWGSCIAAAIVILNEAFKVVIVEKALESFLNVIQCRASLRGCEPIDAFPFSLI